MVRPSVVAATDRSSPPRAPGGVVAGGLALVLALGACAGPGPERSPEADARPSDPAPAAAAVSPAALPEVELPDGLEAVLRSYEAAWQARDAEALAGLFCEDGLVLSPGRPPVRGREAIRRRYARSGGPLHLRALAYERSGPLACVIGAFARDPEAPALGKFTLVLRQQDGRWLILSDMDNDDG